MLAALARTDAAEHRALGLPDTADGPVDAVGLDVVLDPVGGTPQGELAQGHQVAAPKEVRRRALGLRFAVDLAGLQAGDQLFGRHVDEHHLVGAIEEGIGQRFGDADSGDAANDIVEALEMLDVERRPDVDAGRQQLADVLPALRVARARDVRMGQLVDEQERRPARQCRVEVELGEGAALADRQLAPRQQLEPLQLRRRVGAAVRLHDPGNDVEAGGLRSPRRGEHREGLADPRRRAEVDPQPAAPGLRLLGTDALDERVGIGTRLFAHRMIKATWPCGSATT